MSEAPPEPAGDALQVAVAVLQRQDGRVLVAERPAWRHQGGGLEFPGGKLDRGESVAAALARECAEELGIGLREWTSLMRVRHDYADRRVVLHVALVRAWAGDPHGLEDQRLDWLRPADLQPDRFPAANRPIVAALCLPPHCLVTPPRPERELDAVVAGVAAAIERGERLLQLRAPGWGEGAWRTLLERSCALAGRAGPGVRLLANSADPAWLDRYPGLAGLHLGARSLKAFRERPVARDRLLSCACHDAGELEQAARLDADLVVVGHVRPTPGHAQETPLGWDGLEALAARSTLPVYAIGGLGPADLPVARQHGAVGIAAIRGLWPGS